jgi:hypothetical protein
VLQGLERYKGRWIVYSIGNFVFGSPGRYALFNARPYSAIAELALEVAEDGSVHKFLRLYPIVTDNAITNYRGRFVTEAEYAEVSVLLAQQSRVGAHFDMEVWRGSNQHGRYFQVHLD